MHNAAPRFPIVNVVLAVANANDIAWGFSILHLCMGWWVGGNGTRREWDKMVSFCLNQRERGLFWDSSWSLNNAVQSFVKIIIVRGAFYIVDSGLILPTILE